MGILEDYEAAHSAFQRGAIVNADDETLLKHLHGLSNQYNINTGTQHRDVIRGLTIQHILLKRHVDMLQAHISRLNNQNTTLQVIVIVLAAAAVIGTGVQTYVALNPRVAAEGPPSAPSATKLTPLKSESSSKVEALVAPTEKGK
ncbi:MAG: hypothetical protein ACRD3R_00160 [Terriglobales bacterium]